MTVRFQEYPDSRTIEAEGKISFHYWLSGIHSETSALAYVTNNTEAEYEGLFRQNAILTSKGASFWDVEIPYGPQEPGSLLSHTGESWCDLQFDTAGGTAHVTQAKEHIGTWDANGTSTHTHQGAIGVTADGVEGTDVVVPQFTWTERRRLPIAYLSFSYVVTLKNLTGKVNNAAFRGFAAGEVRFDGAVGAASNDDPDEVEITYRFTQSDNTSNAMPDFRSGISKGGWQYLWVEYEKVEDDTHKTVPTRPKFVHVERVYDSANFLLLQIGAS